jgi:hypothetical protein
VPLAFPVGFAHRHAVAAPIALGTGTTLKESTNFNGHTWGGAHSPATGKVIVLAAGRCNGSSVSMGTVTLGATTLTQRVFRAGGSGGEAFVWIGTGTGLATGSALAFEIDGNNLGNIVLRIYDLSGWGGSVGDNGSNQTDTGSPDSITASIDNLVGSGSFCVGVVGAVNGACDPFTASGWTHLLSTDTGPNNDTDTAAGFFRRTGGAAGTSLNFTPTSDTADNQWACGLLELI